MSDLYTYVMKSDTGLAPNPFWGICTLAVCTPNHQGSRAKSGDWIVGVSEKHRGYKLIHAMEVDERLHMDDYFRDERFTKKKPLIDGTVRQRCGDNFYSLDNDGHWMQHPNRYHDSPSYLARDTRHPWVFVARRFWYLGREATSIPAQFMSLFGGRGARVNHPAELAASFKDWVDASLAQGMNALPRDLEVDGCQVPLKPSNVTARGHDGEARQSNFQGGRRESCGIHLETQKRRR